MKKTDLNTEQYDDYMQDLARSLKADLPEVIDHEAAAILKLTAKAHKPAKTKHIKDRVRFKNLHRIESSIGKITINKKGGRMWYKSDSGKWQIFGNYNKGVSYTKSGRKLSNKD